MMDSTSNISIGGTVYLDDHTGQHISARSEAEVQRGIRDMIRTKSFVTLIRKMQKRRSWAIITGCPGEGKTTLAYFVLNYFREKGFKLYIIKSKEEYFSIREFNPKSVVMINDIFGAFAFDLTRLDDWLIVLEDLEQMISTQEEHTSFHVVMTMRNYVLKTALAHLDRFSTIFDDKDAVIDLTSSLPLDKEEKKAILRCHLKRRQIKLEQEQTTVEKICDLPSVHGFPHCCQMFSDITEAQKDPIRFFSRPLIFLNNTTRKLMQNEKVRKLFYAILHKNGSLRKDDATRDEYGVNLSRNDIDASHELVGSFLTEVHNTMLISHPSVLWSIAFVIGSRDPEFLIKVCPLYFINDLVILAVSEPSFEREATSKLKIAIKDDCIGNLLDRFVEEIEANNLSAVLSHQAFCCETFTEEFLSRMRGKRTLQKFLDLKDRTSTKSFLELVTSSRSEILLKQISKMYQFTKDEQKKILLGYCEFGSAKTFRFFLEKYPDLEMTVVDENKRTPLTLAAQSGNKDVVELLLPHTDIHAKDFMGMNALHCSLERGQTETACTLVQNGMDVNEPDGINRSALHYAAWGGYQNVVCFLLEKGADVNMTDKDDATALHDVCYRGYEGVADILIKAGSDINKQNAWGETPLTIAATHGHTAVVRCLLRSGCDVFLKNGKDQMAECIAKKYGHGDIVEIIHRHLAKLSMCK